MSDEQRHLSYVRQKLGGARTTILDEGRPLKERLESAFLYNLSALPAEWFPDADGRQQFEAIVEELTGSGEAIEGAGSVPTTLWLIGDDEAEVIAARILALADSYLTDER